MRPSQHAPATFWLALSTAHPACCAVEISAPAATASSSPPGEARSTWVSMRLAFHFAGGCDGVGDAVGLVNAEGHVACCAVRAGHVTDRLLVVLMTEPDRPGVQGQGQFSPDVVSGWIGPAQVDLTGFVALALGDGRDVAHGSERAVDFPKLVAAATGQFGQHALHRAEITIACADEIGWVGHLDLRDRGREVAFVVGDEEAADDSDPVVTDDLDLEGHGPALVTRLFLSRSNGVGITKLADALKDAATANLAAEEADRQWQDQFECPR